MVAQRFKLRFGSRFLLLCITVACLGMWWFEYLPWQFHREQLASGQSLIHSRDRIHISQCFDKPALDRLITVLGDSRLTHWAHVRWLLRLDPKTVVSYGSDNALIVWNYEDGFNAKPAVRATLRAGHEARFVSELRPSVHYVWPVNNEFAGYAMTQKSCGTVVLLALWALCSPTGLAEDWWQFRGPSAGHTADNRVPAKWGGFLQEPAWKATIPGKGWSSPIVVGDRIWLTSAEQVALDVDSAAETLAERPFQSKDFEAHASVALFALELDASSGKILRRIDLFQHDAPTPIHWMNSYASPTPVTDGARVYCHYGASGTACIEIATGDVLWKRELKVEEITGSGASPVLWKDCLYLACDGADQQYVIALDKLTGETKWKVDRPAIEVADDSKRRSFSTPIIIQSNGRTQLISLAAQWLVSYNPEDGSQWWRARVGTGFAAVPTPVFDRDRVFICTGYSTPDLVAVSTTGSGDVTESAILWRYSRQVPEIASPLLVGDELYFASSKGIVTCLDAAIGEMVWQHRIGGSFAASPTYANDRIYWTNTQGVTTVIKPGREYVELAKNEWFGETYASLAVYRGKFLLRTHPDLICLGSE